jgi:hypothetical protein
MPQLSAVLISLCLLSTCSPPVSRTEPPPRTTATVSAPFRGASLVDQTVSMRDARVGRISPASFTPVYERLAATGGEFALGLIRDRSDRPLVRLYVPPPPAPPLSSSRPKNIFDAAAARKREDADRARYEVQLRAWRAEAAARINIFTSAIAPLLDADSDARRTDIGSAILRANLFLAEPTSFSRGTENVILLITDGVETVRPSEAPRLTTHARVLLVNGTGSVGYLGPLHPVRFEGLDAALRFAMEGERHVRR